MSNFNKLSPWGKQTYLTYYQWMEDAKGVYGIFLFGQLIYIGSSKNILQRIISHVEAAVSSTEHKDDKKKYFWMWNYSDYVTFQVIEETEDYVNREEYYIELYKPIFNIKRKGGYYYASNHIDIDATIDYWYKNFYNLTPVVIPLTETTEENQ